MLHSCSLPVGWVCCLECLGQVAVSHFLLEIAGNLYGQNCGLGPAEPLGGCRNPCASVPLKPFPCDDSDSGFRILPLVMPRKRFCFRQTLTASAQATLEPVSFLRGIFQLGIFQLGGRLTAEIPLGRWDPICAIAQGGYLSSSLPLSVFGDADGWSVSLLAPTKSLAWLR